MWWDANFVYSYYSKYTGPGLKQAPGREEGGREEGEYSVGGDHTRMQRWEWLSMGLGV